MKLIGSAILLVAIAACFAAGQEEAGPVDIGSDERFAVIFAESGPRATFEQTRDALNILWDEVEPVDDADYAETKEQVRKLVHICHFDKANCATVFDDIDEMNVEIDETLINLHPYVAECGQQQRIYCQ